MEKPCSRCKDIKPYEEFYKQKNSSTGRSSRCKPCAKDVSRKHYADNKTEISEKGKKRRKERGHLWKQQTKEEKQAYNKKYYAENREREIARNKKYREDNYEKVIEKKREFNRKNRERLTKESKEYRDNNREHYLKVTRAYRERNKGRINAHTANRRALRKKASPKWLTKDHKKWMTWLYKQAKRLTKMTGIPHEVDHIYPLRNKKCCGLHVPWNLQIIPKSDNRKKSNKLPKQEAWYGC